MDIFLKNSQNIKKAKKLDMIFKIAILDLKNWFLFITFTNPHLMISICQIKLYKLFYPIKLIKRFFNKWERISIFDNQIIQAFIINTK